MERHQADQEETLMKVLVETNKLKAVHPTRGPPADLHGYSKCAIAWAAVMGFVTVALLVAFILCFVVFPPSWNQDPAPMNTSIVVSTCNLTKSDGQRRYDIFTADKAAHHLVLGWVKFPNNTSEEVVLKHKLDKQSRTLQTENVKNGSVSFSHKVLLFDGSKLSIYFESTFMDGWFHVYELRPRNVLRSVSNCKLPPGLSD